MPVAPLGTPDTLSRETDFAQFAASLTAACSTAAAGCSLMVASLSCRGSCGAGGVQRRLLVVVDADGLVEASQLEDLPVVIGQPEGEQLLRMAVRADQERDQQPDAATVHVRESREVQHDRLGVADLVVGRHE